MTACIHSRSPCALFEPGSCAEWVMVCEQEGEGMKTRRSSQFNPASSFRNARRSMAWATLCLAFCMLAGLALSATPSEPFVITTVDAPGAGTGPNQGTQSIGINSAGAVTGFYADSNNVVHGFVRAPNGAFTTFEAPGAGAENVSGFQYTESGALGQGTYAVAINDEGAVTGFYADSDSVLHGFLRSPAGNFTTFDAPAAGTGATQGTWGAGISSEGVIAGYYEDADDTLHGFVRASDGTITTFDAPGAATGNGEGTLVGLNSCINAAGAIAGEYTDSNGLGHSFVRAPNGAITEFEAPGAATGNNLPGTQTYAINELGAAAGAYWDANFVSHGYVRTANGQFINFDVPGASTEAGQGSSASDVNSLGVITGGYTDESGVTHGLVRAFNGKYTTLDVPGVAISGAVGTEPVTINEAGAITGVYSNAGYGLGVVHGFIAVANPLVFLGI